jgi:hypothetical protein
MVSSSICWKVSDNHRDSRNGSLFWKAIVPDCVLLLRRLLRIVSLLTTYPGLKLVVLIIGCPSPSIFSLPFVYGKKGVQVVVYRRVSGQQLTVYGTAMQGSYVGTRANLLMALHALSLISRSLSFLVMSKPSLRYHHSNGGVSSARR